MPYSMWDFSSLTRDIMLSEISQTGNSLEVQWLGLVTLTVRAWVQSQVWGLRFLQAALCSQKKKKRSDR